MTNVTGTVTAGTVTTTFTGTTSDAVTAGTPFNGTIAAVYVPPPPPTGTIKIGLQTVGNIGGGGNGNLYAQPITLTQPASLVSLTFNSRGSAGQVRLGLYSGATPKTLVAQTAAFVPANDWNTIPLTTPVLPAGQYWLTHLSSISGYWAIVPGGPTYYKPMTFGAMPATYPASPSSETALASFYGTFSTTVTPPPPPPPPPPGVPIGIGLSSVNIGNPPNANKVVGVVSVTDSDGGAYPGQIVLGGTDAAKFVITNSGRLPCNLVVGSTDLPAGTYNITLTAN